MAANQYKIQVPDWCQREGLPRARRQTEQHGGGNAGASMEKFQALKGSPIQLSWKPFFSPPLFNSPAYLWRIIELSFSLDSTLTVVQGLFSTLIFILLSILAPHHNSRPFQVHLSYTGWPEIHSVLKTFPKTCPVSILFWFARKHSFRSILRLDASQPNHIRSSWYLLPCKTTVWNIFLSGSAIKKADSAVQPPKQLNWQKQAIPSFSH